MFMPLGTVIGVQIYACPQCGIPVVECVCMVNADTLPTSKSYLDTAVGTKLALSRSYNQI